MKIGERIAVIETELKGLKKIVWVLVITIAANMGVTIIPW